jgi:serine/threonine-protein kinase
MAQDGITEVGKYRVIEQVGEGAMGVVYRALDPVLNRTVAIKVMGDALARDDDLRTRFLREAQAAGSLQHPNIVTIYDFGEVEGHLFIAMEFVEGEDLETMLHTRAPMSIVQKIDVLEDVLSGLGYAHKRGIVHRDIKPPNIRIDEEGRARIMDFGIAHLQSSRMTRTGLMVGTPAYMAPEQVTGGAVSPQSDIFSVGAVMYELFTGNKPFEGESLQSLFFKIVSEPPLDFSIVAPSLPSALNAIAMRALAKNPAERYASASDMANDLAASRSRLDPVSSHSKPLSLNSSLSSGLSRRSSQPVPTLKRSRTQVVAVAATGVVLVAAAIGGAMALKARANNTQSPVVTTAPVTTAAPTTNTPTSAPASAPAPAPQTVVAPPPSRLTESTTVAKTPEKLLPRQQAKIDTASPSPEELSLLRSLQTATLEARRRASEAGASIDLLRAGDDHNVLATSAAKQGKVTEAMAHLNLANTAWTGAERDARTAAAAAAQAKTRANEPKQDPVVPPASVAAPPASVPASQTTTQRTPAPNPAVEIEAVLTNYERAIDSRDLAELRRAYPGMTSAQSKGWEDFFKTLRSIHATLTASGLDVRGDAADARVSATYDYVTTAGKTMRDQVSFQASFRREGGAWRLIAVR